MVRPIVLHGALATLALLLAARPAPATPITLTGNVANDFNATDRNVEVIPVTSDPNSIGVASWMTSSGLVSGWAIKDIRLSYDAPSDTLSVGVNTFGVAGDADGNGNPGVADPRTTAMGGVDPAHLGGLKSISIGLAPDGPSGSSTHATPVAVAGIPAQVLVNGVPAANKQVPGTGTDGFTVASYKNISLGLQYNYGPQLTNNQGILAFDPSQAHPGLEFTIKNFSTIPGLDPLHGFWLSAYAGSPDDVVAGEASLGWTRIPRIEPQTIPEPATVVAWSLVAGGAAWRLRRRQPAAA